jgi:hypothetical protein
MSDRTNTFSNKINIERKVLKIINDSQKFSCSLNGLTIEAINRWVIENDSTIKNQVLIDSLLEISKLCKIRSDNSKEVFELEVNNIESKIDEKIYEIEETIGHENIN